MRHPLLSFCCVSKVLLLLIGLNKHIFHGFVHVLATDADATVELVDDDLVALAADLTQPPVGALIDLFVALLFFLLPRRRMHLGPFRLVSGPLLYSLRGLLAVLDGAVNDLQLARLVV